MPKISHDGKQYDVPQDVLDKYLVTGELSDADLGGVSGGGLKIDVEDVDPVGVVQRDTRDTTH